MNAIYGEYRSAKYTTLRNRWEPWYSTEWNAQVSYDETGANHRRESLKSFLLKQSGYITPQSSKVMCVVDVGGDIGQFIPFGATKYVIEVSERQLAPGVMRASCIADVNDIDLIICAHLLEHLLNPVEELLSYDSSPLIYIEIPFGVPIGDLARDRAARMFGWIARIPFLYRLSAHPATGRKPKSRWASMIRQSEHINFFSVNGINSLATRANRQVLAIETADTWTPDGANAKVIRALLGRMV